MPSIKRLRRYLLIASTAALLSGCASFSDDRGMTTVSLVAEGALRKDATAIRSGEAAASAENRVKALLKKRLTADDAVQIALLNNRDLQAAYNALGIAEAAMVQASLPPNPTFSVERLAGAGSVEIEARIVGNILNLATLPARAAIAQERYRQAQLQAAEATLRVAAETRRAYYNAVAASALADFLSQSQAAAETAAQLSTRLGESGTMNKLDQARNQVFFAELSGQLGQARLRADTERERLVRSMGLWGGDLGFRLPARLPRLPSRPEKAGAVEVEAVSKRVDLQVARLEVKALAQSYGLTEATRFINLLEVAGIKRNVRQGDERERERGFEVEFQVPLFDFGQVNTRRAEETYLQAVNRLVAKAVNVRSEAREAYRSYRANFDLARHYQGEVLPLRKIISDETLLRYNAMQIDVFALLIEARQRIAATSASIEAARDFWIAQTNLTTAIFGGGAGGAPGEGAIAAAGEAEAGGH